MRGGRKRWAACWGLGLAALVGTASVGRGGDNDAEMRALLEKQGKLIEQQSRMLEEQGRQIELLKRQMGVGGNLGNAEESAADSAGKGKGERPAPDENAVKKIVGDYLRDNPGAGMPPGVQTGYNAAPLTPRISPGGFVIRSAPNPSYVKWQDDCRIPFELRIRGRLQAAYEYYKSTDNQNHLTGRPATFNAATTDFPDFSQLLIKRGNIIFEGSAFYPDLRYRVNFNGFTRGAFGNQFNEVVQNQPPAGFAPSGQPVSTIGGGVLSTQPVTLFEAFIAYDFHGCAAEKGCGAECPEGSVLYRPHYTMLIGKMKPFFGLDEFLGNQNEQFVEFSMADLMFDADDDSRLMAAGFEMRHLEDRFFLQALVTNGSEAFTPNLQMDSYPGFIVGSWYDFGGSWNEERKAWNLFGDCISDIDYSCSPVARVGGCANLVPLDRRSYFGDAEQARYFTMPGAPGGTRLINLLNGGAGTLPAGGHAVDKFDAYTYNVFAAGKYQGLSLYNEWWLRNLNNFRTTAGGRGDIIYQTSLGPNGTAANALFPANNGLFDYGMNVAMGYFLVPKKLEVAARWAWVSGQSGDINGNRTFRTVTVPGVPGLVQVVDGAFTNFHGANEYTIGVNYYIKRQLLKWQTDFSIYDGGNPAGGGQSIAGFIAGVDGWMVRSQIQLAF